MKKIDKFTIIVMTVIFVIAILYMFSWALALMSVNPFMLGVMLGVIILIIYAFIPLVIGTFFAVIMFIIRYIKLKRPKLKRIIKTIFIVLLTIILIILSHYILWKYGLSNTYRINVSQKINEIKDVELQSILVSKLKKYDDYKEFKIEKIIISQEGFPDDYHLTIYYKDSNNRSMKERGFLSDSKGYNIVSQAENLSEKSLLLDIALFILNTILLIFIYIYLRKEYRKLSEICFNNETNKDDKKITKKEILLIIGVILVLILVIIVCITAKNSKKQKKETIYTENEISNGVSSQDYFTESGDVLYEKKINENIRIRVVFKGAVLAQRSIIGIEKTTDGGQTWIKQLENYDGFIQIHNGSEYVFLDENIGFINDPGLAGTNGENRGLLVTTDGGKTFSDANIIHPSNITEKNLFVSEIPYIEDGTLKVKIYTINHNKTPVETYYEFTSKDNGKTWKYSKKLNQ